MREKKSAPPVSRPSKKAAAAGGRSAKTVSAEARGEGASTELARKINRDVILELIRLHQPISRVELARTSGLQNSTVSSIVEQLVAESWIREGEALKTARGRRPTQISLNDRLAMLVADIHPGRAIVAAVDLNGQILVQQEMKLAAGVQRSVDDLGNALAALRDRLPERAFMGVGVCLPGRVHTETGRLMMAPNLHWRDYDIRAELVKRLGLTVELENDANACLLSELWFGHLDGVRNAVLLAISEGLGASLLADGHLIAGRMGLAGEFGHICVDPAGAVCGCGRRGCWEVFASCRAALGYYEEGIGAKSDIGYAELARLALAGDAPARHAIEQQAVAIGIGLRMVTAALSPEVILFTGELSHAWSLLAPIVQRECERTLLTGRGPRLACTGDGQTAHLLGAAALVLQRHSGYYRSRSAIHASNAQLIGARALPALLSA